MILLILIRSIGTSVLTIMIRIIDDGDTDTYYVGNATSATYSSAEGTHSYRLPRSHTHYTVVSAIDNFTILLCEIIDKKV